MKKLIFIILFLTSQASFGQIDRKGNGGDAVVCRDAAGIIKSTEVFDYFEAKALRNIDVQLMNGNSAEEIAVNSISTIEKYTPGRARELKEFISKFMSEVQFVPNLVDIPDSNHIALPKDCDIEQLVVQQVPTFPEDKRFLINEEIWNAMPIDQRAGMIIHEALYTEALRDRVKDSRTTRYFHTKMVGRQSVLITDKEFIELSKLTRFKIDDFKGLFKILNTRLEDSALSFSEEGRLLKLRLPQTIRMIHPLNPEFRGSFEIFYLPTGEVVKFHIKDLSDSLKVMNQNLIVEKDSIVQIFSNGDILLNLSAEYASCFKDIEEQALCGIGIKISSDGKAQPSSANTLNTLKLPGWTFSGDLSSTTWKMSGKSITFDGGDSLATFVFDQTSLKIDFKSLEGMTIVRAGNGVWIPVPTGDVLNIERTSQILEHPISDAKDPVIKHYSWQDHGKPQPAGSVLVSKEGIFFVRPEKPFQYLFSRGSINVSAIKLSLTSIELLTSGENRILINDADYREKSISIKANSYVSIDSEGVSYVLKKAESFRVSCNGEAEVYRIRNVITINELFWHRVINFRGSYGDHLKYCKNFRWH